MDAGSKICKGRYVSLPTCSSTLDPGSTVGECKMYGITGMRYDEELCKQMTHVEFGEYGENAMRRLSGGQTRAG